VDRCERGPVLAAVSPEWCEFCEHRSPHFRWAAEPVSAKESDRSVAIAHPNAAVSAAVAIDVLQCRGPGRYGRTSSTGESSAHLVVVKSFHKVSPVFSSDKSALRLLPTCVKRIVAILPGRIRSVRPPRPRGRSPHALP
jgi:hypothetical protein